MSEQIRSADLLVKSALSNPQTLDALGSDPKDTLEKLAKEATDNLPRMLPNPTMTMTNIVWFIIVGSFALVMLWSAYILGSSATMASGKEAEYITKSETILTIFTTVVAFLAGLVSPSPVR